MKKLILLLAVIIALTACARYTPPKQYRVIKERVYQATFDEVWSKIVKWFAVNNTPIKNIEKESGLIATDYGLAVSKYSSYADCGDAGPLTKIIKPTANFNVLVEKIEEYKTKVLITFVVKATVEYYISSNNYSYTDVECNSTGVLEKQILDYIEK